MLATELIVSESTIVENKAGRHTSNSCSRDIASHGAELLGVLVSLEIKLAEGIKKDFPNRTNGEPDAEIFSPGRRGGTLDPHEGLIQ
jgi:hypothetical protein